MTLKINWAKDEIDIAVTNGSGTRGIKYTV